MINNSVFLTQIHFSAFIATSFRTNGATHHRHLRNNQVVFQLLQQQTLPIEAILYNNKQKLLPNKNGLLSLYLHYWCIATSDKLTNFSAFDNFLNKQVLLNIYIYISLYLQLCFPYLCFNSSKWTL